MAVPPDAGTTAATPSHTYRKVTGNSTGNNTGRSPTDSEMLAPDVPEMETRALAAEAKAAELLAEVRRLQLLLGSAEQAAGPPRRAAMIAATGAASEQDAAPPPPASEPQAEQAEPAGWALGGWGLDAVKQAAAVALESTGAGGATVAAVAGGGSSDGDPAALLAHRWSRFSSLWVDGTRRQCICLADAKGCQVWDVEDPTNVRPLAQLHLRGVSCMAPLHSAEQPPVEAGSALLSDPSILALGATDDEGSTTLAFYSVGRGCFVQVQPLELTSIQSAVDLMFAGGAIDGAEEHLAPAAEPPAITEPALDDVPLPGSIALQIRLPKPVCDLISAEPHLVVAVDGAVALLDSCSAMPSVGQKLRVAAALPPPPTEPQRVTVAIAATENWLAYAEPTQADTAASPDATTATEPAPRPGSAAQEELSLSSALTAATDMGSRLLDAVTQPPEAGAGSDSPRPGSGGVVVLERLSVKRPGAPPEVTRLRFTAHRSSPVSALQFDRTGRLLVTASQSGKTLKVFRMPAAVGTDGETSLLGRPVLLYTLTRGTFMDADICSISFSDDSLFVAVATSHGTAHVFAISPSGGAVDAITHGIDNSAATASMAVCDQQSERYQQDGHAGSSAAAATATVPNLVAVARVKRSWIPSHVVTQGFPESQTATHYTIRCSTHSGATWEVSKRYSELAALKAELERQEHTAEALERIAKNAEFPAKTWGLGSWGKLDESTIKARKEKLQLWLGNVLQYCVNEPVVLEFLRPDTLDDTAVLAQPPQSHPGGCGKQSHGEAGTLEWPIRVEFVKTENKSDGTLLPMAVAFFKPGGGGLIDANGVERMARDSFMVFSAGQLSLHHLMMDIAVTISDGGDMSI